MLFSCYGSIAAPRQRPGHHDQVPAKTTSGAAGVGLGAPRNFDAAHGKILLYSAAHQQNCSSPAATASRRRDNDLGITIKYLRKTASGSAGIGLDTTITYLRRRTGAAAGNGLGTKINYLRGAAGNGRAQR